MFKSIKAVHNAGGKVIYCDTDSMVTTGLTQDDLNGVLELDEKKLGAWDIERAKGVEYEHEGEIKTIDEYKIQIQREKAYKEILIFDDGSKKEMTTYKGVPDDVQNEAFEKGEIEWESMSSYSESIRKDVNPQGIIKRQRVFEQESSSKRTMTNDYSKPINYSDIEDCENIDINELEEKEDEQEKFKFPAL